MRQNRNIFFNSFYFKLTTFFGPCCGQSSGYKTIYYSKSHKIYHSKMQRDLLVAQHSNGVSWVLIHLLTSPYCITKHNGDHASKNTKERFKISFPQLSLSPISLTEHFRLHVTTDCALTCMCICVSKASVRG